MKSVTTVTPGIITVTDLGYGSVSVNQTMHESHSQVIANTITRHYATFVSDDGEAVELEISDFACKSPLYLWCHQEFWVFQNESMSEPYVIMGDVPGTRLAPPFYPSIGRGLPLSSDKARKNIQTALFDFREFLQRIGKESPRTLLSVRRLQDITAKAKSDAALSYQAAHWPNKTQGFFGRYLPVLAYSSFSPKQIVSGQINKRWLGLGIGAGLISYFLFDTAITLAVMRATSASSTFFWMSFMGFLAKLLIYVGVLLVALLPFMKIFVKKPFIFDEDAFSKLINTSYHPKARVGLFMNQHSLAFYKIDTDQFSASQRGDYHLYCAHQLCELRVTSHDDLVSKLSDTKLTEQEQNSLLSEIAAISIPL